MMHSKYEQRGLSFDRERSTQIEITTEYSKDRSAYYAWPPRIVVVVIISACTIFAIFLSVIGFTHYETHSEEYTPINDHRIYKGFMLSNSMEVMVVSDPLTTSSSAAISVGVGTLQNPREINGLAHLLEHMLFLGNTKYQDPSTLGRLAERGGGFINAYTTNEETNFYFVSGNDEFQSAIDITIHITRGAKCKQRTLLN